MGLRRRRRKPKTPRRHPASPAPAARQPPVLRPVLPSTCSPETEIRTLQKTTHLLLRKTPFSRLAGEICVQFTRCVDFSWQAQALLALQEAAEAFLVHLFEVAYLLSLHAGCITLLPKDVQLARRIRGIQEGLGRALATCPESLIDTRASACSQDQIQGVQGVAWTCSLGAEQASCFPS